MSQTIPSVDENTPIPIEQIPGYGPELAEKLNIESKIKVASAEDLPPGALSTLKVLPDKDEEE